MVSTSFAAPVGEVLDGKFRVTKEIGRGGMATVYAAENVGIGKRVAVKILSEDLAHSKTVTGRFLREARAAAKIHSPYICEVYDVGTYRDRPFIVMELLQGESLYDKLARERWLSAGDTLLIAAQTAKGLEKAHRINVVHRDLKPENIFLTQGDDGGIHTKLVDFGLAKFYEPHLDAASARLTKEGALFGTPAYMSPEQAKGKGNVDHRSDLWALGCIVFEMLTGRTVWDLEQGVAMILAQIATAPLPRARDYRPDLPPAFEDWLARALSRKVEQRFQSAEEFVAELTKVLTSGERAIPALRSSPGELPSQPHLSDGHTPNVERSSDASNSMSNSNPSPPQRSPLWWYAGGAFGLGAIAAAFWMFGGVGGFSSEDVPSAEAGPLAEEVALAQAALRDGQLDEALEQLQRAFDEGRGKATRSLLSHASAAKESPPGACELRGIAHPRPFDSSTEGSKPGLFPTNGGLLATWADAEPGAETTHARVALLDGALRRTTPLGNVTPEARIARDPEIYASGSHLGLLYWDFDGDRPGAYTRLLDQQGRIVGSPQLLSSSEKRHPYYPALAQDEDGSFWSVWVEPTRDRVFDLHVRQLNQRLEPTAPAVAVTGYATPTTGKTQVDRPSIAVSGKLLVISYTLRRGTKQQLMLLRVAKDQIKAGSGVVPDSRAAAPGDEESDRFLGQVLSVSERPGNHDESTVRCRDDECYITWDEAQTSAHIALARADGSFLWRRKLGADTTRPGLALHPASSTAKTPGDAGAEVGLLAWYQSRRVQVAKLTREGPGEAVWIGRVSAELQQRPPLVVRDERNAGTWFVGWRGYEAAVPEPFIARVSCRP